MASENGEESGTSIFYYFYCLIDFIVRNSFRITLAVVLALYVYLAVELLREATKKNPTVLNLIYWRDVRKSGVVFGLTILFLLSFSYFNIVTILSYLGLVILAGTLGYRAYTAVQATMNKTEQKNPFQAFLEKPVDLPQGNAHDHVDTVMNSAKELAKHLRRLFLVENIYETLKFGAFLWALTYVGDYVTGTTLILLAIIGLFTLPKVYELYQPQIDNYYNQAKTKVKPAVDAAQKHFDKIPTLRNKQASDGLKQE